MPQKVKDRPYDSDDLQELMAAVAGWAQGWDDVVWYLKAVAPHDHALLRREHLQGLVWDIEHLKRNEARFTTDYRELYREITGLECQACSPPHLDREHSLHLRQVADKWLHGLRFPATKEEALARAKQNHAPDDTLAALRRLDEPSYRSLGALLQKMLVTNRPVNMSHP